MNSSREGFRERRRRKKAARDRLAEKTELVRAETRARAQEKARAEEREKAEAEARERAEAPERAEAKARAKAERRSGESKAPTKPKRRRRLRSKEDRRRRRRRRRSLTRRERVKLHRAQLDELWVWTKGVGLEIERRVKLAWANGRRRLEPLLARGRRWLQPVAAAIAAIARPVWRLIRSVLAPIAPFVSAGLFLVLRAIGGLLSAILGTVAWVRDLALGAARAVGRWVDAHVTAARTFAVIAAAAAVALAVSQFIDYRATAIGAEQYSGEVGTVADVPRIDQEPAGDPHFWVLLPLAIAALPLIWMSLRGRSRLALWVAAIGAIGVVVSLAVDLPQGLDTGLPGEAYEGTEAQLLEGFWTQLIASLVLVASGLALWRYSQEETRERGSRRELGGGAPETPRHEAPGPGEAPWGAGA